ncbi:MAG: hypothetical protein M9932_04090 [Xanthobacteraceae bacterium]|nr:hypothetical protein [Xanthobacteraceae bacterium]
MDGLAKEAFSFTGPFPILQVAVLLIVMYGIYATATRGQRDSGARPDTVPQWLLIAPAHDLIDDVAEMAEHMRRQTAILEKIEASLMACKVALELIRDESRLR